MTRICLRTIAFTLLGGLLFVLFADSSADACHRRHRRRCNGCYGGYNGGYNGGYAYGGKYGGAYYRGTYGAPAAPYGDRAYGGAEFGAPGSRGARGTIEGGAGARVDGSLRSPSDRARAGAEVEGGADVDAPDASGRARVKARGDADAPPPPTEREDRPSDLPPPRSDTPEQPAPIPAESTTPEPTTPESP